MSSFALQLSYLTEVLVSSLLHLEDLKASLQSGKTKGKTQGAPGLRPVRVLQGKLLDPSWVFMFRKVISSDLVKVMLWKYSFAFLMSSFPVCSKLKGKVLKKYLDQS